MLRYAVEPANLAGWRELPFATALQLGAEAWHPAADSVTSPFQRFEWHAAWHAVASAPDRSAAFVLANSDGEGTVRYILPLARRRKHIGLARVRALTWPAEDFGCPDHLDLPIPHAAVSEAAAQLLALDWEVLVLGNLAEHAPGATRLAAELTKRGCRVSITDAESCPTLELPASWDDYLAAQSPSRRQTIRRKERKLAGAYRVTVREHGGDSFEEGWQALNSLHCERWANGSAFTPEVMELHRRFAKSLAESQALWLTTLELDGIPAAAWYGFAEGDTVYFYQSGRSAQHAQDSVGQVLMGMMIRRAIERGYRRFDFLRGDEPYKAAWTRDRRVTSELVVTRPGMQGLWLGACRAGSRGYRLGRARVRRMLAGRFAR